jgi:hypothetical protein
MLIEEHLRYTIALQQLVAQFELQERAPSSGDLSGPANIDWLLSQLLQQHHQIQSRALTTTLLPSSQGIGSVEYGPSTQRV